MHANPDDKFSDPDVGPSDRLSMNMYMRYPTYDDLMKRYSLPPFIAYKLTVGGYLIMNGHHRWAVAIKSGQGKIRATIQNPSK